MATKTTIYVVIPLSDEHPSLREIVQEIDSGAYVSYEPKVYFLRSTAGTAEGLSERLGFTPTTGNNKPGVVLRISEAEYYGFASGDLWTWVGDE